MGLLEPTIQATPRQNKALGLLSDALGAVDSFVRKPFGYDNPPVQMALNAIGAPGLLRTLDRMSYGEPLYTGKGQTARLRDDTVDALGFVPLSPRTAAAVVTNGLSHAAPGVEHAATVWHGTPHKFDKFDSSKIGTGEGAQAYGHGLYLAESPDVAKTYQEALSGSAIGVGGKTAVPAAGSPADTALAWLSDGDFTSARAGLAEAGKIAKPENKDHFQKAARVLDYWEKSGAVPTQGGQLYKVDLPDEAIARMLDFDGYLSEQPQYVRDAISGIDPIKNLSGKVIAGRGADQSADPLGSDLIGMLQARSNAGQAAQTLRAAGIPGIRYLDGGSRGTGQGTSNFVVFPGEEGLLTILERNGQPVY